MARNGTSIHTSTLEAAHRIPDSAVANDEGVVDALEALRAATSRYETVKAARAPLLDRVEAAKQGIDAANTAIADASAMRQAVALRVVDGEADANEFDLLLDGIERNRRVLERLTLALPVLEQREREAFRPLEHAANGMADAQGEVTKARLDAKIARVERD